jgi:demethylmenaquinone methyltransferase/2-methoxy-6-polyprenyl-1,4-benzoquinol methylase
LTIFPTLVLYIQDLGRSYFGNLFVVNMCLCERVLTCSKYHPRYPFRMPDAVYVHNAFARIADRYVLTNHVLSCGMDILWRKIVTARIRKWKPQHLLDVASGTGDLALEIQDACPDCHVIASDFCAEMLVHAASRGMQKTIVADALNLPFSNAEFDVVTVAFGLRNMADYPAALREMWRVLKPGGRLLILDFSLPSGILRIPYRLYLHHILPHLAGWLTGQRDAYEYLGGSIEQFPAGDSMKRLLESCGFSQTDAAPITGGVVTIYEGSKS